MTDYNILEVLGIDPDALGRLTSWQKAALALEVLYSIELPARSGTERNLGLCAREAVDELKWWYD